MKNPHRERQVAELKKLKAALAANRDEIIARLQARMAAKEAAH